MTVVNKPYIIFDIEEVKKAEINIMGKVLKSNPDLDVYRIRAILKSYIEKTEQGFRILEKLGHGDKLSELNMEYLNTADAFTVCIPVTAKTINWNKYRIGNTIMVAYYPPSVWASFHCEGAEDNNDDLKRKKGG